MANSKSPNQPDSFSEESVLKLWQKEDTFEKSRQIRQDSPVFSFYDGPPFANGLPHFGHSLVTSIKDALGRYKTMQGYYVERRNGWDTHGLPVEFAIEKELGISGKKQILELGLDKFNAACRASVFAYKDDWEQFFTRIGRWADTKNAYATIDRDYTESVWWVMKQIHDKGLLYKGFKSLAYCPRCETPLSNFELNEGYQDNVEDPSLYIKFRLLDNDNDSDNRSSKQVDGLDEIQGSDEQQRSRTKKYGERVAQEADAVVRQGGGRVSGSAGKQAAPAVYLLAWTTTPWSLPGNAAIAVKPEEAYVYVKLKDEAGKTETLVLAKRRLDEVLKDEASYEVIKEVSGQELTGKKYQPLFKSPLAADAANKANLFQVWSSDIVDIEDGTGVLHVAPAFGEDDLQLGLDNDIPVLSTVDSSGHVTKSGLSEADGKFFKSADKIIIEHLTKKGAVFSAETFKHTYPFCYRCDSPLLYLAVDTWFIKVSSVRPQLLKTAESIHWTPAHIKKGRFGKWLEGARDWAVSRNRYWGAPMPIWVNEADPNDYIVVGSISELRELAGSDLKLDDLHRPFIDEVKFAKNGKRYKRIDEVIDCWFESGSMMVAQQHYPFENKEKFEKSFPADYIGEGLDQTRLWFYVLHVVSTILFDKPAYRNVLVNGMILAADGQKLSKRLRNYPPLEDVFSREGADSLRLYLLSNNQALSADYMRFNRDGVGDLKRNVISTLQNSHHFFKMYSSIDNWKPKAETAEPQSKNILDQWIIARLNQTIAETTKQADHYKLARAITPIFELIDDLSNWYIRRSRRRFWKSDNDQDKEMAYSTLHYLLVRVSQLLAPWAPFYSDYLYRDLMNGASVHLSDWPEGGQVNSQLIEDMNQARQIIAEALAQRAQAKLKVRQPLAKLSVPKVNKELIGIITDEVNVKQVDIGKSVELDTQLTQDLLAEGMARELIRQIQNLRKQSGLQVENRIILNIKSTNKLVQKAVKDFAETIKTETLAVELSDKPQPHKAEAKIDDTAAEISLSAAKS